MEMVHGRAVMRCTTTCETYAWCLVQANHGLLAFAEGGGFSRAGSCFVDQKPIAKWACDLDDATTMVIQLRVFNPLEFRSFEEWCCLFKPTTKQFSLFLKKFPAHLLRTETATISVPFFAPFLYQISPSLLDSPL